MNESHQHSIPQAGTNLFFLFPFLLTNRFRWEPRSNVATIIFNLLCRSLTNFASHCKLLDSSLQRGRYPDVSATATDASSAALDISVSCFLNLAAISPRRPAAASRLTPPVIHFCKHHLASAALLFVGNVNWLFIL